MVMSSVSGHIFIFDNNGPKGKVKGKVKGFPLARNSLMLSDLSLEGILQAKQATALKKISVLLNKLKT